MSDIKSIEEAINALLKEGCKVMEVTVKKYYVTYPHEPLSDEQLKNEWFGTHLNRNHAYKDASHIGGADELIDIKFLSL